MPRSEPRILVVDDHVEMARLLADDLGEAGYAVTVKDRGADAIAALKAAPFDLVITDLRMESTDGLDVLRAAHEIDPGLPVMIMTAFGGIDSAVEAIKRGAFHYLTKPFRLDEVRVFVERALQLRQVVAENRALRGQTGQLTGILGDSAGIRGLREAVLRVAASPSPVLIRGESGTGKELVARAIHAASDRAQASFIAVNCTAIPATLLESELFGHVRGSFTGAATVRRGLFVEADGGTLFLDEIGDMPAELQAKLLRVLEDGEVRPVGADAPRKVDVRIVAATHQDLDARIAEGAFRQDLFYRLHVLPLAIPPLREHREDVPRLVEHFLARARARNPHAVLTTLAPDAIAALSRRPWPGNVRELENLVERLVVLSSQARLDAAGLEAVIPSPSTHPIDRAKSELVPLRRLESDYIAYVVAQCDGNKTRAAEILGIDVSTIHRRGKE